MTTTGQRLTDKEEAYLRDYFTVSRWGEASYVAASFQKILAELDAVRAEREEARQHMVDAVATFDAAVDGGMREIPLRLFSLIDAIRAALGGGA